MEPRPDVDEVTGLPDRKGAEQMLDVEWRRAAANQGPLGALLIEIDDFAPLAEQYGPDAAAECVRRIAKCVRRTCHRAGDVVARFGESQFIAFLPRADDLGVDSVAERVRRAVYNLAIPNARSTVGPYVTVSVGAGSIRAAPDHQPTELLDISTRRLDEAKRAGKNRRVGPTPRSSAAVATSAAAQSGSLPEKSSGCVLVVAGSGDVVAQLSEWLGVTGCEFQVENAGTEAIASGHRGRPNLILLDVDIEDADAYEVCRRLKADPTMAPVPVVMIGPADGTIDRARVFEAGATDYLQQPLDRSEVLARVEHQLELARVQAGLRAAHARLREIDPVARRKAFPLNAGKP